MSMPYGRVSISEAVAVERGAPLVGAVAFRLFRKWPRLFPRWRPNDRRERRLLGQIAVAIVLALLLGGHLTGPAEAENNDRQSAIDKASGFVADCFANGGEPDAETQDNIDVDGYGFVGASCSYDDGQIDSC